MEIESAPIERMIQAARLPSNDQNVDQNLRVQGKQLIRQLYSSIEGIHWAIDYFDTFTQPSSKEFCFELISFYLQNNIDRPTDDPLQSIQEFLFETISFPSISDSVCILYSHSFTYFLLYVPVETALEILHSFLSSNGIASVQVLKVFLDDLMFPSPLSREKILFLKSAIMMNQSLIEFFSQLILQSINTPTGILAFSSLCRWMEITDLGFLSEFFSTENLFPAVLDCFSFSSLENQVFARLCGSYSTCSVLLPKLL